MLKRIILNCEEKLGPALRIDLELGRLGAGTGPGWPSKPGCNLLTFVFLTKTMSFWFF